MKCTMALMTSLLLAALFDAAFASGAVPPTQPTAARTAASTAAASSVSTATPPVWQKKWDNTLAQAKREGSVMVYGAQLAPKVREALTKGFQDKYGIKLELVIGSNAEVAAKWQQEKTAGLNIADTFMTGSAITTLAPMGALASFEPYLILPEVLDSRAWPHGKIPYLYKDKTAIPLSTSWTSYVAINTNVIKEGQLRSYKDLLKPEWKGKIAINDPSIPGAAAGWAAFMITDAFGPQEGREYLREFAATKPVITKDVRQLVEWVARDKYPIGVGAYSSIVTAFKKQGAPVDFNRFVEGGNFNPAAGVIHVSVTPPHPAATTVFINWLLTREGQRVYNAANGSPPVRLDVKVNGVDPGLVARPGDKAFWTDERFFLTQGDAMKLCKQLFGL